MVETLAFNGAPRTPEVPGRYKDVRAGVINVTNARIKDLSRGNRSNISYVRYDLSDTDILLDSLIVGHTAEDGTLSLVFEEPGFKETVRLTQEGEAVMPLESSLLPEFARDIERRLDMLLEVPAHAVVMTNYRLAPLSPSN